MTIEEAKKLNIGTLVKLIKDYAPWKTGEIVNVGVLNDSFFDMTNDPKAEGMSFVLPIDFIETVAKKEVGLVGDIEKGTLLRVKRTFYPWEKGNIIEVLNFTPADMSNIDIKCKIEKHFTYGISRDAVTKVKISKYPSGTVISFDNLPETGPSNDSTTDYTKDYAERPKRPEDVFYRPEKYLIKASELKKPGAILDKNIFKIKLSEKWLTQPEEINSSVFYKLYDAHSSFGLALLAKEKEKAINNNNNKSNNNNNNNNNHIKLKLFDVPKI